MGNRGYQLGRRDFGFGMLFVKDAESAESEWRVMNVSRWREAAGISAKDGHTNAA